MGKYQQRNEQSMENRGDFFSTEKPNAPQLHQYAHAEAGLSSEVYPRTPAAHHHEIQTVRRFTVLET